MNHLKTSSAKIEPDEFYKIVEILFLLYFLLCYFDYAQLFADINVVGVFAFCQITNKLQSEVGFGSDGKTY